MDTVVGQNCGPDDLRVQALLDEKKENKVLWDMNTKHKATIISLAHAIQIMAAGTK